MPDTDNKTAYVKELAEYVRGHFAKQKTMIRAMREMRALMHEVKVPPDYKTTAQVVRSPILTDMVQRIVATLSVNYPTWTRGLIGDRPTDEKDASLIEKWVVGAHQKMEQQARRRTFRMLMDAAVADGMAVGQYTWNRDAWNPFPGRKKDEKGEYAEDADPYLKRVRKHVREKPFPFAWKDIDPLNYYFWDSYDGEREVVLIEEVPLAPAARSLGVRREDKSWLRGNPGQPAAENSISGEKVELIQHWTANSVKYLLDGEMARQVDHNWGRMCFFDFAGLSTHERAPERAYLPVAFAFKELIPFIDALLTMKANAAWLNAFPRGVLKLTRDRLESLYGTVESAPNTRSTEVSINLQDLSSLITLEHGEEFAFMTVGGVNEDVNQMLQLSMSLVDRAGLGDVMRGQGLGSDSSGYLANQLMTAARLAYDPITDNAKFMLRDGASFLLYGVDKLAFKGKTTRQGVAVWGEPTEPGKKGKSWLELSSEHIDGIYEMEANLDPLLPSNLIMEGRFGLEQVGGGAISMYTHREKFLRLPAPEEEEKRIIIEQIKSSPQIQQMIVERVMKEAGLTPPEPPQQPPPGAGMVDQYGQPLNLGNTAMPVTPGQGMSLTGEEVMPGGLPAMPGNSLPGAAPTQNPGGQFGRQVVTNAQ